MLFNMELNSEDIRQKYNKEASSYDWRLNVLETLTGMKKIRRELLAKASGNALAVAIGTGRDLLFYPRECTVTGIDLSEEMLRIAETNASRLHLHPALMKMDAESLTFLDDSFDTVVSTLALCTFPHPEKALQEMRRVCRPDGKVLLLEHGKSSLPKLARLQGALDDQWCKRSGCHLNRKPDELVRTAGFEILSDRKSFFGILHSIVAKP
ncbi:MAG: methyltransferase type 11 [Candidatus Peregrinibacteria bacterium Greene0416_62]|nr:MAG: methyltransferase type 11 [Candidatus Peregrinibacteria bacterium Greene0416_62]TSC99595.1 MAG: methyltransferase type 11 [Candidatus Peregrinibacteria bacterium Greene1014_49]